MLARRAALRRGSAVPLSASLVATSDVLATACASLECPRSAAVAHNLGKVGVTGSIPVVGSSLGPFVIRWHARRSLIFVRDVFCV
jgi:hypothetical protein